MPRALWQQDRRTWGAEDPIGLEEQGGIVFDHASATAAEPFGGAFCRNFRTLAHSPISMGRRGVMPGRTGFCETAWAGTVGEIPTWVLIRTPNLPHNTEVQRPV